MEEKEAGTRGIWHTTASMLYILQNMLGGEVKDYQQQLVDDVADHFDVRFTKEQRMPPHFTLKYGFETGKIEEVEKVIGAFCEQYRRATLRIGGFDHFDRDVIFTKVALSKEAEHVFQELRKELLYCREIDWSPFDLEHPRFHTTIAQRCQRSFDAIMGFLKGKERQFDTVFDNITILRKKYAKQIGGWDVHQSFELMA